MQLSKNAFYLMVIDMSGVWPPFRLKSKSNYTLCRPHYLVIHDVKIGTRFRLPLASEATNSFTTTVPVVVALFP